jgi:Uma2 family endonuclease
MGNLATAEALVLRWDEVLKDPSLQDSLLAKQLPDGVCISECSILARIGVRAPEVCIGIVSPSNVPAELEEKRSAYLEAGAHEVWLVAEDGRIRYFDRAGEIAKSSFPVEISLPPPMDEYR